VTIRFTVCTAKMIKVGGTSAKTASFKVSVERGHCVDQNTDGKNVIKCIRNVDYVTDRDNAWRSSVYEHESTNSTTRKSNKDKKTKELRQEQRKDRPWWCW